jgi:hypothetical protein
MKFFVGLAAAVAAALAAPPAQAATCNVPSASYPTIGAAVVASTCTTVQLAAGTYPEDVRIARDLAVQGAGSATTVIAGLFQVTGASTDVTLASLRVDGTSPGVAGCWPALLVAQGGAQVVAAPDVDVRNAGGPGTGCRLLNSSFETGDLSAWSASQPSP